MPEFKSREEYERWKAERAAGSATSPSQGSTSAPSPPPHPIHKPAGVKKTYKVRELPVWQKLLVGVVIYALGFVVCVLLPLPPAAQIVTLIIAMLYVFFFPFVYYRLVTKRKVMVIRCPNCKYEGAGSLPVKGHFLIELVLWITFIVPGVIYSIWRVTNKKWRCPTCDFNFVEKLGLRVID